MLAWQANLRAAVEGGAAAAQREAAAAQREAAAAQREAAAAQREVTLKYFMKKTLQGKSGHAVRSWHGNLVEFKGALMQEQIQKNRLNSLSVRIGKRMKVALRAELGGAVRAWKDEYLDCMSQQLRSEMEAQDIGEKIKRIELHGRIARRVQRQAGATYILIWHQNMLSQAASENSGNALSILKANQDLASRLNGVKLLIKYSAKDAGFQVLRKLALWKLNQQFEEQQLQHEVLAESMHGQQCSWRRHVASQQMMKTMKQLTNQYAKLLLHRWRSAVDDHNRSQAQTVAEQRQKEQSRQRSFDRMAAVLLTMFKGAVRQWLQLWFAQSVEQRHRVAQLAGQHINSLLKMQAFRATMDRQWLSGLIHLWHLRHCSDSREQLECRSVSLEEQLVLMESGMNAEMRNQVCCTPYRRAYLGEGSWVELIQGAWVELTDACR